MASQPNPYAAIIAEEERKLAVLREKVTQCEQRIAVLTSYANADELDSALTRVVSHTDLGTAMSVEQGSAATPPSQAGTSSSLASYESPKRRLTPEVVAILRYVGSDGKNLSDLEKFCELRNLSRSRTALRAMMSNYRNKYGFIESDQSGFYRLSARALAFLDAKYPELQSEAPSVSAEGASISLTLADKQTDPDC